MIRAIQKISQEGKNFAYSIKSRLAPVKDSISLDVPFVCQFAIPEHAEKTLTKKLSAKEDPHWALTGAASPERYAQWAFTMCGMACTSMALKHFHMDDSKAVHLAEDALKEGVYIEGSDDISALRYREFALWIRKHGIDASIYTRLGIRGIQRALGRGELVIVSVNPNIRGYATAPADQKGGHLVLVTGYDSKKGFLTINNPSGFLSTDTQLNHEVKIKDFLRYFASRGIVLKKIDRAERGK